MGVFCPWKCMQEAARDPENCFRKLSFVCTYTKENRPKGEKEGQISSQVREEKLDQNSDEAFGKIIKIIKCFLRSVQKLYVYFSGSLKF